MNLTETIRTTPFRLALAFAAFFAGSTLLLFGFIYLDTATFETARVDALIENDARIIASEPPEIILQLVSTRVTNDFHRVSYAGLFTPSGKLVAGNLSRPPPLLPTDGQVHVIAVTPLVAANEREEKVRAVARILANGSTLVIGRDSGSLEELRHVVLRALAMGLIPAVLLSLATGIFLSARTQERVKAVHLAAQRIMNGNLRERLPTHGRGDDFDRLSDSVNRMLDEIERLMAELQATGDEIAHDLRTPLTRVRARLERTLKSTGDKDEVDRSIRKAITGLDQTLSIITALLRIREIEAGQRRSGFRQVDLHEIIMSIDELYQPIAEEKGLAFETLSLPLPAIFGDRDLLMEAVGNLVDNAIKFTQRGGSIRLSLQEQGANQIVEVADTGCGIQPQEREIIFTRFYRSERNHQIEGTGLGLSLVAAITKLHEASILVADNRPGSIVDLTFATQRNERWVPDDLRVTPPLFS